MKGFDLGQWVNGAQSTAQHLPELIGHWTPVATATAGLVAFVALTYRLWIRVLRWFGYGVTHVKMRMQRDEAVIKAAESERARQGLREMVSDLNLDVDRLEASILGLRARLHQIEAEFEVHTANEWLLLQDREHAIAWGRVHANRLAELKEPVSPEPVMMGIPVAEPDQVVQDRFAAGRDQLALQFQDASQRATERLKT